MKNAFAIGWMISMLILSPQLASAGRPDLSGLNNEEQSAIERACRAEKMVGGPAAYYQCLQNQLAQLKRSNGRPDLSGLNNEERSSIERACRAEKRVSGPAAYYQCLQNQLNLLGEPIR